jgi:hypothetical protein
MENIFQTKKLIIFRIPPPPGGELLLLLLLTVTQCKQRCTRTSLPCNVTCSGFKIFFSISKASKFSIMQILVVSDLVLCDNMYD